jgi:CoA:oxalate CoA-transferase
VLNRNKLSITLDLKKPKAVDLIKDLVKVSDVVLENFAPGAMVRLGLGYEVLSKINPELIMISLSGPGAYGPYKSISAYAPTFTSMAGMESLVGYPDEEPLGMIEHNYGDVTAALHAFVAGLQALMYRNRTGKGQLIDAAGIETVLSTLGEPIMDFAMNNRIAKPLGNFHPAGAPYGIYRCKGEDEWISIAAIYDEEWSSFCKAIGDPPWTKDQRFSSRFDRVQNRAELDELVESWTMQHSKEDAEKQLLRYGVAAAGVYNVSHHFSDPHLRAREMSVEVIHPLVGAEYVYGIPFKLSGTPGRIDKSAPLLGADNDYVFGKILGLPKETIEGLIQEQVIY